MLSGEIWSELGIEPTEDRRAIERAYARRLKEFSSEDDREGVKRLRSAYEAACKLVERGDVSGDDSCADSEAPGVDRVGAAPVPNTVDEAVQLDPRDPAEQRAAKLCSAVFDADDSVERLRELLEERTPNNRAKHEALERKITSRLATSGLANLELLQFAYQTWNWSDASHPLRTEFPALFDRADDLNAPTMEVQISHQIATHRQLERLYLATGELLLPLFQRIHIARIFYLYLGDIAQVIEEVDWVIDQCHSLSTDGVGWQPELAEVARDAHSLWSTISVVAGELCREQRREKLEQFVVAARHLPASESSVALEVARANAMLVDDRVDEAIAQLHSVLEAQQPSGDASAREREMLMVFIARCEGWAKTLESAEQRLQNPSQFPSMEAERSVLLEALYLKRGDVEQACRAAQHAVNAARQQNVPINLCGPLDMLVKANLAAGKLEEAERFAESAAQLAEQLVHPCISISARLAEARFTAARGDYARSRSICTELRSVADTLPIPAQRRECHREIREIEAM